MNFIENFVSKLEQQNKIIGQLECAAESLPQMLVGMLQSMGMTNPVIISSKASKGIKITKKGNKYTLILYMFEPPLKISWTSQIPFEKLHEVIDKISSDKKNIGYMNIFNVNNHKVFQLALAN